MGMDVFGNNPATDQGKYFRANVWSWRPLWDYCEQIADDIIPKGNLGHSNDGWGLNEKNSKLLARRLKSKLFDGYVEEYAAKYKAEIESLPDEKCDICDGTGMRKVPPVCGAGDYPCNGCAQKGFRRPFITQYYFSIGHVAEFADFLEDCGGFKIC